MNIISKPINFIKEVKGELTKVSWSSREELMGSTTVVISITALLAVFIGLIDLVFSKIVSMVYR